MSVRSQAVQCALGSHTREGCWGLIAPPPGKVLLVGELTPTF